MVKKQKVYFFQYLLQIFCLVFIGTSYAKVTYKNTDLSETEKQISITIPLKHEELLYANTLIIEVDHPGIHISDITIQQHSVSLYDPVSKETKRVYEKPVTILATVSQQTTSDIDVAHLHITYATDKQAYTIEKLIPLTFKKAKQTPSLELTSERIHNPYLQASQTKKAPQSFSRYISRLLKTSDSLFFQLMLAFLLGVLLSLTPCVYPMIPITVGILHSYGTQSFLGNAIRAITYTFGIAITYAMFGLLASCTGPLCGYLLVQPIFVYVLVLFLVYLAGSMLGLYELYIPRFMQIQQKTLYAHSLWSVFLFGVVSGTIASPCVSPGLALILSVIATVGNTLLGFLFLFLFGIGLSMPLLIIGTFSSSLNILPRAGIWMVEAKKPFGFLLLALCIYYLTNVLPWNIILLISALCVATAGILYFFWARRIASKAWKKTYNILGTCLLASSVLLFFNAVQETFYPYQQEEHVAWSKDFDLALATAQKNNKLLFVDVWAQFCSICIAINKSLLADESVLETFQQHYVLLKVDGTSSKSEPYAALQKQYAITGFPTFLIINPHTKEVIKRWDSKIYAMPKERFIEKLTRYSSEFTLKNKK